MASGGSGQYLMAVLENFRIGQIEKALAEQVAETPQQRLRKEAADLVRAGGNLTRQQAAAYLGISTKQLWRYVKANKIARCPQLGRAVMFSSRDVLRFASAQGKES